MRSRQKTRKRASWSCSRILILALTFFASAGLGTLGINAVSSMSQMAMLEVSHHAQCTQVKEECGCDKIKDKRTGKCIKGENKYLCTCTEPKSGEQGKCFKTGCCARNPSGCGSAGKGGDGKKEPPKKEEPKGEGGKPPELPKGEPKQKNPQDQKCMQDANAPECKQAQNPWYCSIPGGSLFSSKCSENAELPQTGQAGGNASEAISDLAGSPVSSPSSPSVESSAVQPVEEQAPPTVPTGPAAQVAAQELSAPASTAPVPPPLGGYTPPEFSGFTSPDGETPLTESQRNEAWWTLEGLRSSLSNLVNWLTFWR